MNKLEDAVETSLINNTFISEELYQVNLIKNQKGHSILSELKFFMSVCDEMIISAAFITQAGITALLAEFIDLEKRNIPVKILTGDYLNFTQPLGLKKLMEFNNVELRMIFNKSLHAKGYFFRSNHIWHIMIGSVNLTQSALKTNNEWLLKVSSLSEGSIVEKTLSEFHQLFELAQIVDKKVYTKYSDTYEKNKTEYLNIIEFDRNNNVNSVGISTDVKPNKMQVEALENIKKLIDEGENKALLISATGTGKTYLSAFMVKEHRPKKVLFVVHRETIAIAACKTFESIISDKSCTMYTGTDKSQGDYVFATIQTLSRDQHLHSFEKEEFDFVIIDEVHRAQAATYQKVINYFKPRFLFGMTATPERTDGLDIYSIFDYNIAYEIRLHQALEHELVTPFHYFGVQDIINAKGRDNVDFEELTTDQRVLHIIEKANMYSFYGKKRKALIFVSRTDEAQSIAGGLNKNGYKTVALTGSDSEIDRRKAIKDLENGDIEFIISVDIFNEGVDIPCVNQVLLLRPTKSAVIYTQQIGRGLRLSKEKEYVIILDFIANYKKDYLISVALSGDGSYDKNKLTTFIKKGTDMLPGESTVNFEKIVAQRIYDNISKTNFSTKKNIKASYRKLKMELGRIPLLADFYLHNEMSPKVIMSYDKFNSIDDVICSFENIKSELNDNEKMFLRFLSRELSPALRPHEFEIIKQIMNGCSRIEQINYIIENKYNIENQLENTNNALLHLQRKIFNKFSEYKKYIPLIKEEDSLKFSNEFKNALLKERFKIYLKDIFAYNELYLDENKIEYYTKSIELYSKYSKPNCYKAFNLDYNNGTQVRGYSTVVENQVLLFSTMDDSSSFTSYENKIIENKIFEYYSQDPRYLKNKNKLTLEGKMAYNQVQMNVFLRRNSEEEYYFVGKVKQVKDFKEITSKNNKPQIKYIFELDKPIPYEIINYLI